MSRIFLIRHGETTGDIEDRYGGDYDDELTDKGRAQASELATKLKDKGIEIIFHSPKLRAAQTAAVVSEQLSISLIQIENIRERNRCGILSGMIRADALKEYPAEVEKLNTREEVKDSEPYDDFKIRITAAFDSIANNNYNTIAIVTHGGVISGFVKEIAEWGITKGIGDCGIIELNYENDTYSLINLDGVLIE